MKVTSIDVLLYYPNLIGYARVICLFIALFYATNEPEKHWRQSVIFYLAGFAGDAVDGLAARHFNQSSRYGGVLDMVTDRVATAAWLALLSKCYPEWAFFWLSIMTLDISSHWFHVVSVQATGHHKSLDGERDDSNIFHRILKVYYSYYYFFGYCCVGAEVFLVSLFVLKFYADSQSLYALCWYGCLPGFVCKHIVNIAQLASAAITIAHEDAKATLAKPTGSASTPQPRPVRKSPRRRA
jgi:CDP-diacylglycerol--inositol 3-phosphatidyltransferase